MKVLLLSRYARLGPSSRIRCHQYVDYLRTHAIDVTSAPFLDDDYIRSLVSKGTRPTQSVVKAFLGRLRWMLRAQEYDLLWMQYEALPWLPHAIERLLMPRVPYVVDYDDAQFHRYDEHPSGVVRRVLGSKLDRVMSGARVVVAGNQYLAARARQACAANVEVIPSAVDLDRFQVTPPPADGPFTIGWIGSPISTRYLAEIALPLRDVCQTTGARVVLVGSGPIDLTGVPVEHLSWEEATEAQSVSRFHVGIMPLYDGPMERGKCGFKLLQYMACGRPVVASAIGANLEIVRHGDNGFLASGADEWVLALRTLAAAPDLRTRMGIRGRAMVEQRYSTAVVRDRLRRVLTQAVEPIDRIGVQTVAPQR